VTAFRLLAAMSVNQQVALAVASLACVFDLRSRHIPNLLTLGAAGAALCYALVAHGPAGLAISAGGWLTACALFFPFFALRGLGAGDVKLAAAIGAWLTPTDALWFSLYAMVAGGMMALLVALLAGYLRKAVANLSLLLAHWRVAGIAPIDTLTLEGSRAPRLPYALPIAAGAVIDLFWR
jgi:prepilin peptidase CpaA